MKRTLGILAVVFSLAFTGLVLANNDTVYNNPSGEDTVVYCVTNHFFYNGGSGPIIGEATAPRQALNGVIYQEGGTADQVCSH